MRFLLRDLTPGTDYAIQFRSNNGENVSEWSQIQRLTTTNDTIRPGNVLNLSWTASGATFIAQWDKVTADENGNALRDFRYYRCNVSNGSSNYDFFVVGERFEFSRELNEKTFSTFQTALTISVRAVDLTYNESPVAATLAINPLDPPTPFQPTVGNYLGLLLVTWNGKDSGQFSMPSNFAYVEVHVSTTNGFTPTTTTFAGRLFADGTANKMTIPNLTIGTLYYVRLISVNQLSRRSGASVQASGTPGRISGLDIQNGQISVDQINFTAKDIGGANAYYSTSQPTSGMKSGDIWYDTDNGYTTYRYNGTTWVAAPEIGVITGTKILTGTLTADAVGTNLLIANRANIADALIDNAHIQSLSAAKITTGSIQADQGIIAGDEAAVHAEMRDTGFYVYGPGNSNDPEAPPTMAQIVKMGTDDGDTFSINDPNQPEATLAAISVNGNASFQALDIRNGVTVGGRDLQDLIDDGGALVGTGLISPINGLYQTGAMGIRSEYGIGQFSFPVVNGRSYRIFAKLVALYSNYANPYATIRLRSQQDARTQSDINAGLPSTPVTNSSNLVASDVYTMYAGSGWSNNIEKEYYFDATFTGTVSVGLSVEAGGFSTASDVLKIIDGSKLEFRATDIGKTQPPAGKMHNQGGTLYSWTAPTPPPPPATQQYLWTNNFNWVRSYKGGGAYMTNTDGRAYQGTDPSGYNGNQTGLFGFSNADWTPLASKRIDKITVYLYFPHWYYAAGGTARIGFHSQFADPGAANQPVGPQGTFDVGGWARGAGKELDITSWAPYFKNGAFRGIALGPGNNGYQNYGYATSCTIRVWWTG